ncbi:MAG: CIA30 family protein [Chloracidobacterium sp.]|uniref:CIA30 family protein n=1 Tax=Chloracidobacterium validum TaxID=2821543 RepID=A0ABX8BBX9_9BACT|nr:CIA30 family protein [Chloracidobacterium validum]QUW04436.1 CIA30 family protein [Chloracidobacterium validum]
MTVLFDFTHPPAIEAWYALGDRVMGGRSVGQLRPTGQGHAIFEGFVSFENNGGFASIRSQPLDRTLPPNAEFIVEAQGDGKTYKFVARTDGGFDGVAYQATFTPRAECWETYRFAATELTPTFRGRPVSAPPLNSAAITTLGLMIAGKQFGPFALRLRRIAIADA